MNKKILTFLGIALIILAVMLIAGFLAYKFLIVEKSNNKLQLSEYCREIFDGIKKNDSEELADLYDDIKLKRVDPSLVFTACDYDSEEVVKECMEREKKYQDKLVCMQDLLNRFNISKEDLLKVKEF
jgi:hypothetical protein